MTYFSFYHRLCEKTVHTKTANVYANGADGTSGPRQSLVGAETKPKTGGDEPSHSLLQDSLLGNFKGFSIVPLTQNTSSAPTTVSPLRPAPKSPPVASQTISPKIVRAAPLSPPPTTIMQLPHLPPQNRPLISSPVLDNTTSTAAKKLINRVKPVVRPAPAPPVCIGGGVSHINKQQLSSNTVSVLAEPISCATEKPAKEQSYVTLSRIASLISKSPPSVTPTAPKAIGEKRDGVVAQKAAKIDRDTLKKLKISDPIPLSEPSIPVEPLSKVQEKGIVMRAQSMRQAKKTQRSAVHSFGSMRLPAGTARPPSIVNCSRPTAPPPRPPPEAANEQNESTVETEENIYAVIEEHPTDEPSPPVNTSVLNRNAISTNRPNSGGNGLLDEIVNEMQARNLTSICRPDDQLYVNGGSGESSSGYLKPIKSSTHQRPSSSSNTNSIVTSVPKLSVPEKSAPGYRPFNASKKPTPPVFKPATNSSQCASSSVSAAISKYNETSSSKSHSPVSKRKPTVTVATKSANSSELKEPVKLAKASHVASMHKKFEAQSKFVPAKRGPTS
ncbi:hypothetical protein V9T40_014135 [Parthenolecanium corni]|uniref:Uncharacterized protein n=1 Tax=Parthenolecanium corni TaxID=536013 RepID=A0AAN9TCD3_9HEMI